MTVNHDEENTYLRKLRSFLETIPALARYDVKFAFGESERDILSGERATFFSSALIALYNFDSEPSYSHNKIIDWKFSATLSTYVKRKSKAEDYIPGAIATEVDGDVSVALLDGILYEAFRDEFLDGYLLRFDLIRSSETKKVTVSQVPEKTAEALSREYIVEAIREVIL